MSLRWNTPYRLTNNLSIKPVAPDLFTVAASISSPTYTEMNSDSLLALSAFATPKTLSEVYSDLNGRLRIGRKAFAAALAQMVDNRFLIEGSSYVHEKEGFANLGMQHKMLLDRTRVLAYREAIIRHSPNKVVLEIGCGSGVLSILAAKAGAKKVYAIEESSAIDLARELARANGVADRIEFFAGNSMDVALPVKADVIIHELFGNDPFEENMMIYLTDARRRLLKRNGRFLPERLEVFVVGIDDPQSVMRSRRGTEARRYSKDYGLDFEPLARALESETGWEREMIHRRISRSRLLSSGARLVAIDFHRGVAFSSSDVAVKITRAGKLGGFLVFFRVHLDRRTRFENSPECTQTHWSWPVFHMPKPEDVRAGQEIQLHATLKEVEGKERLHLTFLPDGKSR